MDENGGLNKESWDFEEGRGVVCEHYTGRIICTNLFGETRSSIRSNRNEHHQENVDISDIQLSVGFGESVCAAVERPGTFHAKLTIPRSISGTGTQHQQRNNPSDRDITQQVRQAIIKDKSLSSYAHNAKIITQNGQVTLKGPVRSDEEKRAIEAKATEIVGDGKVTSELEVKPKQ